MALAGSGCVTVMMTDGTKITTFGEATAKVERGTFLIAENGTYTCGDWVDADGETQPCIRVTAEGEGFTGWETALSAIGIGLTLAR